METTIEKTAEVLNDLIVINNDRYEGYQRAIEHVNDADLRDFFSVYSLQSKANAAELRSLVAATEETPVRNETSLSGKFYRAWMDINISLDEGDLKKILSSCEHGEDVAKRAYQDALAEKGKLSPDAAVAIQNQYDELLKAHDQVSELRDSAPDRV